MQKANDNKLFIHYSGNTQMKRHLRTICVISSQNSFQHRLFYIFVVQRPLFYRLFCL